MKKFSILFCAGFLFALPAFAQNTGQSTTYATPDNSPVQVYVTINNTASGNSQTTNIDNKQNQAKTQSSQTAAKPDSQATTQTTTSPSPNPANSLYGNYHHSPYMSNMQTEMLRNNVWQSLVPRKRLYQDPAIAKHPSRHATSSNYSKSKNTPNKTQVTGNQDVKIVVSDTVPTNTALANSDENKLCSENTSKKTNNSPIIPTAQTNPAKESNCTEYQDPYARSASQSMINNPYRTAGEMLYTDQGTNKDNKTFSGQEQNTSLYEPVMSMSEGMAQGQNAGSQETADMKKNEEIQPALLIPNI